MTPGLPPHACVCASACTEGGVSGGAWCNPMHVSDCTVAPMQIPRPNSLALSPMPHSIPLLPQNAAVNKALGLAQCTRAPADAEEASNTRSSAHRPTS